ncbi:phosphoribosylanthranilate isomerase [Lacicoccus alkaliphilus]|uniref:N-(5'-phosphoribosyl)anthranilate isomerase n=1 Tax=Lacicoccus alkaliphilus DSM 16010 TaxID=1123231 RepID=A0A1M7FM92_9BACL|nr:phosphoribosylanthranilate isomerase [Salinicoccus alkaliphilus]SHM04858.1 phosphoribosylanthranilate isomerase [Salinicoccus alkaliphilus DSM 16010]
MTKVKICGMQTIEDAQYAIDAGADFIGFVLAPSKRQLTIDEMRGILEKLDTKNAGTVGVMVNPSREEAEEALETGLDYIQFHGDEAPAFVEDFKDHAIKAFPSNSELGNSEKFEYPSNFILIDSPRKEYYGGSGSQFDWEAFDQEGLEPSRFALAGGLKPENIGEAISIFKPALVDVSSGVESDGKKDPEKVSRFIKNVKEVS